MKIRFSLLGLLFAILLVGVFLAGYRNGESNGRRAMHELGTRIEVLATVEHELVGKNSNLVVQRCFVTNDGETFTMSCGDCSNLFVEITPTRFKAEAAMSSTASNNTCISLRNIPVGDLEKRVQKTMPQLIDSNLISFDAANNSVTIKENSPQLMANIAALTKFTDKRPKLFEAKLRIGKILPDGSQVILHEPTVQTLESLTAVFQVGNLKERISVKINFDDIPFPTDRHTPSRTVKRIRSLR